MILTVTLNAALDVTYEVPAVELGGTNRVSTVRRRAGGKGVNVARVAAALGTPVLATGFAGGTTGAHLRDDLDLAGIPHDFTPIHEMSRSTVTVVESGGGATVFNEPGPEVSAHEWADLRGRFAALCPTASVAVLAGSLPPGLARDAYATLTRDAGIPVILDADGDALGAGVAGGPAAVKPNAEELARATGATTPMAGARSLRARGAGGVLVSLGSEGMLAVTEAGNWRAAPPEPVAGNPTGAGDAAVAAIACGLSAGDPWPEVLRHAVALSAAAVAAPVAGSVDLELYRRLLPRVTVTPADPEGVPCPS